MKISQILILSSIVLMLIYSCSNEPKKKSNINAFTDVKPAHLNIIKKIILPDSITSLIPCDFSRNGEEILAFSYSSQSIFIIDTSGNVTLSMNRCGDGPGEYGEIFGLSFMDSIIVVSSRTHIIFYDKESGKFLREIHLRKLDRPIQMNLGFNIPWYRSNDMDTTFVSLRYNWEFADHRKEVKWLNLYNITQDTNVIAGGISEQSMYSNEDRRFNEVVPKVTSSEDGKYVYMMYESENKLYQYSLEPTFKLDSIFYFEAVGYDHIYSFPKNISDEKIEKEAFKAGQLNNKFYKIISSGDDIFISDSKGLNENVIVDNRAEYMEKDLATLRKHYLRILDLKNGIKTNEILLEDNENHPLNFCLASGSHVVLKQLRKKDEDEQQNQILYIGEIVYEN
ncbi:MAG: hypothetical protein JEZ03_00465 [Bacteroidales bacterium]|nr:hypothetical protein [Bacteroidales bacterium]